MLSPTVLSKVCMLTITFQEHFRSISHGKVIPVRWESEAFLPSTNVGSSISSVQQQPGQEFKLLKEPILLNNPSQPRNELEIMPHQFVQLIISHTSY
ncbi:unnamed protein product [Hymenolepis diminuta]|uniref:Ovule protein n=1 Tax=Hymenolepis diminuta TaxID=6216 RepID=A0A0R3SVE9_HYMDI|nr:unnamed protein product [Hymenolepis diminuta]VUZ39066.1 unnamed protein product [Hymenolepis diminuta]